MWGSWKSPSLFIQVCPKLPEDVASRKSLGGCRGPLCSYGEELGRQKASQPVPYTTYLGLFIPLFLRSAAQAALDRGLRGEVKCVQAGIMAIIQARIMDGGRFRTGSSNSGRQKAPAWARGRDSKSISRSAHAASACISQRKPRVEAGMAWRTGSGVRKQNNLVAEVLCYAGQFAG